MKQVKAGMKNGNTEWHSKTFLEICSDIRESIRDLIFSYGHNMTPMRDNKFGALQYLGEVIFEVPITLTISSYQYDWILTTSDFSVTVKDWLKQAYPNIHVTSSLKTPKGSFEIKVLDYAPLRYEGI